MTIVRYEPWAFVGRLQRQLAANQSAERVSRQLPKVPR